jgi:hypothetical protein
VLIPTGADGPFIYYLLKPSGDTPQGLESVWRVAGNGNTCGTFSAATVRQSPVTW